MGKSNCKQSNYIIYVKLEQFQLNKMQIYSSPKIPMKQIFVLKKILYCLCNILEN